MLEWGCLMFTHLPSLLLFIVGIGVLLLPLARLVRIEREKRDLEGAMGVVVELEAVEHLTPNIEQTPSWLSSTRYRPIVEFLTATGETRQVTGSVSVPEDALRVGERLPVRYDPRDPERAYLDSHAEGLGMLRVPVLICAGFLFFGLVAWSRWTL
jgi:hypothetical protein